MKKLILIFLVIIGLSSCNQTKTESKTENQIFLLIGSWVQPNPINEKELQGFKLEKDGKASSINMATLLYKQWWTEDGKLILVAESIGNHSSSIDTTRYEIVNNTNSILELKNGNFIDKYTKNKQTNLNKSVVIVVPIKSFFLFIKKAVQNERPHKKFKL